MSWRRSSSLQLISKLFGYSVDDVVETCTWRLEHFVFMPDRSEVSPKLVPNMSKATIFFFVGDIVSCGRESVCLV